MTRRIFFIAGFFAIGLLPLSAGAQVAPSVVSFTASPNSITSGQYVAFVWDLSDAGGYSFIIPCITGVKIKYTNGTVLPCGIPLSSTTIADDSFLLGIFNVSGGASTVIARITPKSPGGADVSAASRDVSISVGTAVHPIASFTASTNTTIPETPITLSWTSDLSDGVNMSIGCNDNVSVTSPSYTAQASLPCGTPIFTSDLTQSGSLTLSFQNKDTLPQPLTITLLPTIKPKVYDGGHAERIDLTIASDVLPDPVITAFSVSPAVTASDQAVTVSWSVDNAKGVNLRIGCLDSFAASSTILGTPPLGCNAPLFASALPAKGTYGFYFHNTDKFDQTETIALLPSQKTGFYDGVHTRSVQVTVHPVVSSGIGSVSTPQQSATSTSTAMPSPVSSPPAAITAVPASFSFTRALRRGSLGAEVSALQQFLSKNKVIYPESIVNGVFGPATERAVQRFQKKYGLILSGTPASTGYGAVGPKTRQKLNTLAAP